MFDFHTTCLEKTKHVGIFTPGCFFPHMFEVLTHRYGKRHTCVKKATQLYDCKCLAFSTHVWEKPPTCLFPPELSVVQYGLILPGASFKIAIPAISSALFQEHSNTNTTSVQIQIWMHFQKQIQLQFIYKYLCIFSSSSNTNLNFQTQKNVEAHAIKNV